MASSLVNASSAATVAGIYAGASIQSANIGASASKYNTNISNIVKGVGELASTAIPIIAALSGNIPLAAASGLGTAGLKYLANGYLKS